MRIIRKVSKEEINKKFPDVINALSSPDANYCNICDGLRVHKDGRCVVCNTKKI